MVRVADERRCRHAGEQGGRQERERARGGARGRGEEKNVSIEYFGSVLVLRLSSTLGLGLRSVSWMETSVCEVECVRTNKEDRIDASAACDKRCMAVVGIPWHHRRGEC